MAMSMTGFGRGEAKGYGYQFTVELKAVNHRFLEIAVRLPRTFLAFEEKIKKVIQEKVQRGRIDVFLNIAETEEKRRLVKVDKDLALSYDKSLKDLALALETVYETDIYRLASLPEVLSVEEPEIDLDSLWEVCAQALTEAAASLIEMRQDEGERLTKDLFGRLDTLTGYIKDIAGRADGVAADYQARLRERVQVLLGEPILDETRLANEVAFFADRASITEEIVRFRSHLGQCRQTLRSAEAGGRKLDFLLQELNREINTIGSKSNDLTIAQIVVAVKSELEKVREQIQNME